MAAGDYVSEKAAATGGGTATITVPTNEVWIGNGFSGADKGDWLVDDGTDTVTFMETEDTQSRPLFDDANDPQYSSAGGDVDGYFSGREI